MRTTNGANFLQKKFLSILFWFFSYDIRKEKTKLTSFIICSNSCNCPTSHHLVYLYILDREDKDRIELFVFQ